MGRLIPAGTGMTEYRNTYVVVDEETPQEAATGAPEES